MADEARNRMTFAGRPFRLAPETVRTLVDRYYPLDHLCEYTPYDIDRYPRLQHLGLPPLPVVKPRLNDFYYPTGATRHACFRGLMTRSDVAAVSDLCYGAEGFSHNNNAQTFLLSVNGIEVSTLLYMLPPRPVAELGEDHTEHEGAYLVTLVDERYYWQAKHASTIRPDTLTWATLIDALETALGTTITYDAIAADYGDPEPDSALYSNYENPAALLEAVSHNVGCFVCRDFDGTIRLERWGVANVAADADELGSLDLTRTAGGLILPFDSGVSKPARASVLPRQVVVTFPKWLDGKGWITPNPNYRSWELASYHEVYAVTVSAASLGGDYATLATQDMTAVLRTTAKAIFAAEADADPANIVDVGTLAEKLASDLYDRYTGSADVAYPGLPAPLDPRWGADILVSWPLEKGDKPHTRVSRPAWNLQPQEFQHGFGAVEAVSDGAACAWVGGLTVDSCLTLTVGTVSGMCSAIDPDQILYLVESGGFWTDPLTEFAYDGSSGEVLFWVADGQPHLSIAGEELVYLTCDNGELLFSGGGDILCAGTPEECQDFFTVKVVCDCCSVDGWAGEGWYCVVGAGEDCGTDEHSVVELLTADRCTFAGVICDGPFATEEEANTGCATVIVSCCANPLPHRLVATGSAGISTTDCSCAVGLVVNMDYNSGTGKWSGSAQCADAGGGGGCTKTYTVTLECIGGPNPWRVSVTGSQTGCSDCTATGATTVTTDTTANSCNPFSLGPVSLTPWGNCTAFQCDIRWNITE